MAIVCQDPWLICYHLLADVANFGHIRLGPQNTESRHYKFSLSFSFGYEKNPPLSIQQQDVNQAWVHPATFQDQCRAA